METRLLRESGSIWAKRESGKPTPYLRHAIRWTLSVFGPVLIVWFLAATCTFGQTAQVSGLITDSSGGRVPKANVTVLNNDTGISRATDSNNDGYYTLPLLQPGNYMITAKAVGFATQVRTSIALEVGAQQVLNITLQVGQMTEKVTVTSEAPTVELVSSSLSAVVNSTTVRELPLNGRSWTDLAVLQPGVAAVQTQPGFLSGRGNRGFGAQVTIAGARPQQNNYRLDGASLNDYANSGPGSVIGGSLGVDAIQEFSVLTSNYSAEYGKTSGGVVNAVSRPGTNQLHGSAYEFLRNSALDARNFFDGPTLPPFKRNQFGATGGGPIRKDRTFVFGDYEGIRQSLGLTSVVTVPSAAARAGQLCSVPETPPSCTPTTVTVDPATQKYLTLFALPNGPILGNGDQGIFSVQEQQIVSENFFTTRVDHKFSDKDSLFGTYVFDNAPLTTPDNLNDVLVGYSTKRQVLVLEQQHIFNPNLVNSLRFGFNRDAVNSSQSLKAINPVAGDPSLAAIPGAIGAAGLEIEGISTFKVGLTSVTQRFRWNSFQGYDDVFLTKGLHSLKFGVAVERDQNNQLATSAPNGVFGFGSVSDFLTNQPSKFSADIPGFTGPTYNRQTIFGAYAQDDWRWRPSVTLNLGLRYEMSTVPTELHGKYSNLYDIADSTPHLGDPYFLNPTLRNFEPRVGFAWDPFRNGKTAVRGGFGLFDSLPMLYQFVTLNGRPAPFFENGNATNLPQGSFPGGAFALVQPTTSLEYGSVERKPHRNYVMQWNLNVQREITPSVTALVSYVASRGVHQPFRDDDGDIVIPTLTSQGYLWPAPIGIGTKINPIAGAIRYLNWGGNSLYDAFELGVTKRISHGFQVQGSYTWGKSIDTNSGVIAGDSFSNSIGSLPWFDLKLNRGLSDFNVGRTLVISGIWHVPGRKSFLGPAVWIVNGWELGTIYKANDGVPFTATFGTNGDPLGLNSHDPWDVPNRLTGPGCSSLVNPGNPNNYVKTECFAAPTAPPSFFTVSTPMCSSDPRLGSDAVGDPTLFQCFNLRGNAGRNILIGPGTSNLDFSVFKNNRISENFNVQFRTEFFNILNRANFSPPATPDSTDIFKDDGSPTGVAGLLTSTSTTAREIQFGLKFIW